MEYANAQLAWQCWNMPLGNFVTLHLNNYKAEKIREPGVNYGNLCMAGPAGDGPTEHHKHYGGQGQGDDKVRHTI